MPGGAILSTWLGHLPPRSQLPNSSREQVEDGQVISRSRAGKTAKAWAQRECTYGPSLSRGLAWTWKTLLCQPKTLETAPNGGCIDFPPPGSRLRRNLLEGTGQIGEKHWGLGRVGGGIATHRGCCLHLERSKRSSSKGGLQARWSRRKGRGRQNG